MHFLSSTRLFPQEGHRLPWHLSPLDSAFNFAQVNYSTIMQNTIHSSLLWFDALQGPSNIFTFLHSLHVAISSQSTSQFLHFKFLRYVFVFHSLSSCYFFTGCSFTARIYRTTGILFSYNIIYFT